MITTMDNNKDTQNTPDTPLSPPRAGAGGRGALLEHKLGFDEIRTLLKGHCISRLGAEYVERIAFMTDGTLLRRRLDEVTEIARIIDTEEQLPGEDFFDLRQPISRLRIEGVYIEEEEMWQLKRSLDTMHSWLAIIRPEEGLPYPALHRLADGVFTFHAVTLRIDHILDKYGKVKDDASPELLRLRRELKRQEGSVSRTLNLILQSAKTEGLIENSVMPTLRDGRLVIPVAPALKRRLRGIVHDESATGKTIYVEPQAVVEANNRIRELEADERREVINILKAFADTLRPNLPELRRAYEFLGQLEVVLAKQRLAAQIGAVVPTVVDTPLIDWAEARHPLLELTLHRVDKRVVPLEVELTPERRILIISGPNAGGKSICLKTVGLLQYMLQCGLPVPVAESSRFGLFTSLHIDIGDQQSIEDELSTYSGHLLQMKLMMRAADPSTLLLIDELGSGTEPQIGGALAEAMLARFVEAGAYAVVTTHYQNLKHFADDTPGVINGAMLYDRHLMQPLYQLAIGQPGSSFAIEIARKIGIPQEVIDYATRIVGQDYVNADKFLQDIVRDKRYWEQKRGDIHSREKQMQDVIARYEALLAQLQGQRKEILSEAKRQAKQIIDDSNARVENTIRDIKEAQAERERTRQARQELEQYKAEVEQPQANSDAIDRKMQKIAERQQRRKDKNRVKPDAALTQLVGALATPRRRPEIAAQERTQPAFKAGDFVRLKGQSTVGQIDKIHGLKATITFGMIRTVVATARLEYAKKPEREETPTQTVLSRATQDHAHEVSLSFKPDIDIRGQRANDALDIVTHYIDDAILVGAAQVRILHGTGTGALRQLVRQYLRTVPQVISARDEHVQFGGAGITVVQFKL